MKIMISQIQKYKNTNTRLIMKKIHNLPALTSAPKTLHIMVGENEDNDPANKEIQIQH